MPQEPTKSTGGSRQVEIPFPDQPNKMLGILSRPLARISDEDCNELAGYYYSRYVWETDDVRDLYLATIFKQVARRHQTKKSIRPFTGNSLTTAEMLLGIWKNTLPILAKKEFG